MKTIFTAEPEFFQAANIPPTCVYSGRTDGVERRAITVRREPITRFVTAIAVSALPGAAMASGTDPAMKRWLWLIAGLVFLAWLVLTLATGTWRDLLDWKIQTVEIELNVNSAVEKRRQYPLMMAVVVFIISPCFGSMIALSTEPESIVVLTVVSTLVGLLAGIGLYMLYLENTVAVRLTKDLQIAIYFPGSQERVYREYQKAYAKYRAELKDDNPTAPADQ